jgi:hypothetical protein
LYQSSPNNKLTNIAKANYTDHWYDNNFLYRKQITVPHSSIQHTDTNNPNPYLSNFPVLVSVNIPISKVRSDHNDIIFTNQAGTQSLNYEIESYDTGGNLTVWVKLPQLNDASNISNTIFYMYYGNSNAAANTQTNMNSVWDSGYKAVYHLKETGTGAAGDYKDSTANANNSINTTGQPNPTAGKIGGGQSFNGNSWISLGNSADLKNKAGSSMTFSAWIKTNSFGIIYSPTNYNYLHVEGVAGADYGKINFRYNMGNDFSAYTSVTNNNSPHYFTLVLDRSSAKYYTYIDGIQNKQGDYYPADTFGNSADNVILGRRMVVDNLPFTGTIDEVRISNIARSTDWIVAEYSNQSNPATFYNMGSEESVGGHALSTVIAEVTPVSASTNDSTPSYAFSSTQSGYITYGGDCSSSVTYANSGNNTIIFNLLPVGTHSNCTIQITDANNNQSNVLSVSSFTVNGISTVYVVPAVTDNKILPKSIISSSYISNNISAQVSPGEYKAASFVFNSNHDINDLHVEPSNLAGNGNIIPSSALDIKSVKCWYQSGYEVGSTHPNGRYLTPELLLKDDSLVNVEGDTWNQYNVTNYSGNNYLKVNGSYVNVSGDTQISIDSVLTPVADRPIQDAATLQPINIPADYNKQFWITLHIPDGTTAGSYSGTINLKADGLVVKTINVNVQVLPISLPKPNIDYSIYYRSHMSTLGTISSEIKSTQQFSAEMQDLMNHGVTNPTVYPAIQLQQVLSLRNSVNMNSSNLYFLGIGTGNPSSISAYKNVAAPYGITDFYVYAPDEESLNTTEMRNQIAAVHNVGGKVFDAQGISNADSVADVLDLVVATGAPSSALAAKYHSYGHKIYSYGDPQTVPEYPRTFRQNYGLLLWQNDYDGAMDYAYQHGFGDIWNDFDYSWRDHVFAYPTANGVIDTIQWEGFREGVNDMRYLAALQNAIVSAKAQRRNTSAAENYLTQLKSSNLANQDLDAIRSQMIQYILSLTSSSTTSSSGSGSSSGGGSGSSGSSITNTTTTSTIAPSTTTPSLSDIIQIIISYTPDFKNVSWQTFDTNKFKTIDQTTQTLYVKLKTKDGKISDTIIYTPKSTSSNGNTPTNTPTSNTPTIPLTEGDIIKTPTNPDVYIIKYKNNKQYKRLILSPSVFKSYQHLKWTNLKIISQNQLDQYTTSNLVQLAGDNNIYSLTPYGDEGERRIQNTTQPYDQDSVYEINKVDRDSYKLIK